jgi:hypothetical protein
MQALPFPDRLWQISSLEDVTQADLELAKQHCDVLLSRARRRLSGGWSLNQKLRDVCTVSDEYTPEQLKILHLIAEAEFKGQVRSNTP